MDTARIGPAYNKQILRFFIKLFILVTVWFFSYNVFLRPHRVIDKPLTNFIASAVTSCINILTHPADIITWKALNDKTGAILVQNGKKVFGIWDVCNGIDLMFIYAGVLALLPYPAKRKIFFTLAGIAAITLANILRVFFLYVIYKNYPQAFDFSHHYLFTILLYLLIFCGWILFIKKGREHNEKSS